MPGNINHESQPQQQPAHEEAYIGETPLRLLARLIARDILQKNPFLNTSDGSTDSPILPEKPATEKETKPQP